jgi:hypothetical protein
VVVVHFDDKTSLQSAASVHNSIPCDAAVSSATSSDATTAAVAGEMAVERHLVMSDCVTSVNQPCKPGWFTGLGSSKMMNCLSELRETLNERVSIDVDSEEDNEAFGNVELAEVATCTDMQTNTNTSVTEPPALHPANTRKTFRKVKDAKNVIVIEDSELLEPAGDISETVNDYSSGELKLLDSFTNRGLHSPADCESVTDMSESLSVTGDVRHGLTSLSSAIGALTTALSCETCGWQARTKSQLESHLVTRHGIVDSEQLGGRISHFACSQCGKRYRFFAQLSKHSLQHDSTNEDRLYHCRKCRNSYRHSESLALHSQVHDKSISNIADRFHCSICNKTYATKVLFQKHISYMHERSSGKEAPLSKKCYL